MKLATGDSLPLASLGSRSRFLPALVLLVVLFVLSVLFTTGTTDDRLASVDDACRNFYASSDKDGRLIDSMPPVPALRDAMSRLPAVTSPAQNVTEGGMGTEANTAGQAQHTSQLCVIARAYGSQAAYVPVFLLSLANSGLSTRVFLVNTDESASTADLSQSSELVNALVGRPDWSRFLVFPSFNATRDGNTSEAQGSDFGYALTDKALEYLYNHESDCTHVLVTNADNLYVHNMGDHIREGLEDPTADLVGFQFLSHYVLGYPARHETALGPMPAEAARVDDGKAANKDDQRWLIQVNDATFSLFTTSFTTGHIDLGAAIFRYDFLKANALYFLDKRSLSEPDQYPKYDAKSDGRFIERAHGLARTSFLQRAALFVHQ